MPTIQIRGGFIPKVIGNQKPPVPAVFHDYADFAVAVLNNQWQLTMLHGCAYYNAAGVTAAGGKRYVYVTTGNIWRAYYFWEGFYTTPPGGDMGCLVDAEKAKAANIINGMHLVCPDVFKPDGGFSTFNCI